VRAVGDDLNRSIGDPAAATGASPSETGFASDAALPPPADPPAAPKTSSEAKV
jgi:hypothetical protein